MSRQEVVTPSAPAISSGLHQAGSGVAEQQFSIDDSQMRSFGDCPDLLRLSSDELGYVAQGEIASLFGNQALWPFCLRSRQCHYLSSCVLIFGMVHNVVSGANKFLIVFGIFFFLFIFSLW